MPIQKTYADRDYVDDKALPGGAGAYQQLVTGADGKAKWEDRTFQKKTIQTVEWDGNTEGLTSTYVAQSINYYKVSDLMPTKEEILGCDVEYVCSDLATYTINDNFTENSRFYGRYAFDKLTGYPAVIVVPSAGRYGAQVFSESGLWFLDREGVHFTSFTWSSLERSLYLTDSAGILWRITVGTDGNLTTAKME